MRRRMERMDIIRESDTAHVVPPAPGSHSLRKKGGTPSRSSLVQEGHFRLLTVRSSELDPLWGRVTEAPKPRLGGGRVRPNESPNWTCTLPRPLGDWEKSLPLTGPQMKEQNPVTSQGQSRLKGTGLGVPESMRVQSGSGGIWQDRLRGREGFPIGQVDAEPGFSLLCCVTLGKLLNPLKPHSVSSSVTGIFLSAH